MWETKRCQDIGDWVGGFGFDYPPAQVHVKWNIFSPRIKWSLKRQMKMEVAGVRSRYIYLYVCLVQLHNIILCICNLTELLLCCSNVSYQWLSPDLWLSSIYYLSEVQWSEATTKRDGSLTTSQLGDNTVFPELSSHSFTVFPQLLKHISGICHPFSQKLKHKSPNFKLHSQIPQNWL